MKKKVKKNILVLIFIVLLSSCSQFNNQPETILTPDISDSLAFGRKVAISGDIALVSAVLDNYDGTHELYTGSVYVFEGGDEEWSHTQKLTASDLADGDRFGSDIAISGTTAIIGACCANGDKLNEGAAYIFKQENGEFSQAQKLTVSDADTDDNFGTRVTIYGDTAAVAAPGKSSSSISGAVYIFEKSGGTWIQSQMLTVETNENLGTSLDLSEEYLFVGSESDDLYGSVYVFEYDGDSWIQGSKISASDQGSSDLFGGDIAFSEDTLIVGAAGNDDNGADSGSAYIYQESSGNWSQIRNLLPDDGIDDACFGTSVAIYSDTAVIGCAGAVYIYSQSSGTWSSTRKITNTSEHFGESTAIDESVLIVGCAESAYIYQLD
ncbi:MAG: hypothetical protein PQJ61_04075 [Spirochaetales bacterium]|uniref:PKD domain-containing protein n=1 Tax=Candidatus Thalassospirochaeta sargassi TaxID=3119039 RepID=A0AAJ1IAY3_9SPIO|nr:hypothetical protein [Spirochaetales bacterium]